MLRLLVGLALIMGVALLDGSSVLADSSLQLQPLQYIETLRDGERKRAYVDVMNPTPQPVEVKFNVQAFKQIDSNGTLAFYDDQKITNGILLDYSKIEIPAKKTLRLYFIVDGSKLPTGDVFAAIFAQTDPGVTSGTPSVRIGTLLILTNGTPSVHHAEIVKLQVPWLQIGTTVTGIVAVKNTAPKAASSGFFPVVNVAVWPFGETASVKGPLLFAGNTRELTFNESSNKFGVYKISARYGTSQKSQWVVLVTGFWRWVIVSVIGLALVGWLGYDLVRRRHGRNH